MTASLIRRAMAEMVGTFILVLIGPMSASADILTAPDHVAGHGALGLTGIGLCFGSAVTVVIYSIGHISGAHINPAVTIALWAIKRLPGRDVLPYIIAQLIGAVLAGFAQLALLFTLLQPLGGVSATNLGTTDLAANVLPWQGLLAEIIYTAILLFVITAVAVDGRAAPGTAGLVIGMTVAALVAFGAVVDGTSLNPARTFGPAVASMHWANHWVYWVGPIVGALLGAHLYDYVFLAAREKDSAEPGRPAGVA